MREKTRRPNTSRHFVTRLAEHHAAVLNPRGVGVGRLLLQRVGWVRQVRAGLRSDGLEVVHATAPVRSRHSLTTPGNPHVNHLMFLKERIAGTCSTRGRPHGEILPMPCASTVFRVAKAVPLSCASTVFRVDKKQCLCLCVSTVFRVAKKQCPLPMRFHCLSCG